MAVFLPSEPMILAGYKDNGESIYEEANSNQRQFVAVQEMIHACGLDNSEHDDDVFQKNLIPVGDQVRSLIACKESKLMPLIYLCGPPKAKIIKNWSK